MSAPKGWPSQEKPENVRQQFGTIEPVRFNQFALSVLAHLFVVQVGTDAAEAGSTTTVINATAHAAKRGDIIKFTSGALNGVEVKVVDHIENDNSIPANSITLAETLSVAPSNGDTFTIFRHGFPVVNSAGAINVVSTGQPVQFTKDSVLTDVVEDTVTPANNTPLPVKLTSVTGDINITAGDLNVQTSHAGASYDSQRIGDGANLLGITASNEAKTLDATTHTKLDSLLAELQLKADLTETQPVSAASLPLPTGASTLAEQQTQSTALSNLLTELQLKADLTETQPVSAASLPLPTGAATEATLSALNTKVTAVDTGNVTISAPLPAGTNNIGDVDVLSLPSIPAGTNNIGDVDVLSLPSIPAGTNNIGDVDVLTLPSIPTGSNTIGKVDVNTLSVVDLIDSTGILDTSSTNIPGSAGSPVTLVASLAAGVKKLQVLDTTGGFIGIYTGAAASEVLQFVVGPGSDQTIEHTIAIGTRISAKRLDSTTALSSGILAINFIG